MGGMSRKVVFLAGLSMLANVAFATASSADNAKNETRQVLSEKRGEGGFVNLNSSEGRARSMCLVQNTWVPCEGVIGLQGTPSTGGNKGTYGNNGNNGDRGDKGNFGNNGDHGTKGNYGSNGNNGDHGTKGNYGNNGNNGDHGTKGNYGNNGNNGDHGTKGNYGNNGNNGDHGTKGNYGTKGNNGIHGTKGNHGTTGYSTGYTTGYSTGYTTGYSTGYSTGYTTGHHSTGHTTYSTGYTTATTYGPVTTVSTATTYGPTTTVSTATTSYGPTSTSTATVTTGGEDTVSTVTSTATSTSTSTSTSSSSTGESTSSASSSSTGYDDEDKNEFKAKLKPLFHLSFDYGQYIVNLTPHFRNVQPKSIVKYDYRPSSDTLIYGDYRDGFQKTVYGSIEVGLGAQVRFWFDNATGLRQHFWGYVGVLPIVGKETESVRYVSTLEKARNMGGRWQIPKDAKDLDTWDPGDSIAYIGHGGIIFSAGAGFGPVGAGVAKLANGTWETYVEKVGSDQAYVKMTKGKLNSFSMFTNVSILTLSLSEFRYADDGFSFLFDLSSDTGRKAYEDVIRGNVLASENFATQKPKNLVERAPVLKVETFRSVSTGRVVSKSLAIPIIWDKTYSKGKVSSFTTSDMHLDRNTAVVHYGIFSDSEDSRFWFKHKEKDFMFYGAKYSVQNWDSKARMDSMFGTYSYAFKHEQSNGNRLKAGIYALVKKTGIDSLMVGVPDRDLGYTGIEFNVNFDDTNTMNLMKAAQSLSQDAFIDKATDLIYPYFNERKDPYDLCMIDGGGRLPGSCLNTTIRKTAEAASKMYYALKTMYKTMNSDPKAFASAYGTFGEGMAENLFTFRAAMKMAGPGAAIDYLVEGTHINMYFREWTVDRSGSWVPAMQSPKYKGLPFEPATRHSRVRGMIIGNSDAGKVPHMSPVTF